MGWKMFGAGTVQVSIVALNENTMRIEAKDDGIGMSLRTIQN